jgi:1-acyl-sn-glycerol-3-phosphate acyltransferase
MKMVIVVAPHRQGFGDLLRGLATKTLITFPDNLRILAKKELFRNPLQRIFLKWLGAIPVDRDHS